MTRRVALVTGANRGIGRDVALTLAAEGWDVLAGVRDPMSAPPGTRAEVVDVGDPASIAALADRLRTGNVTLDALVNNAGVYKATQQQVWNVNVRGPWLLTRALAPLLCDKARVVMVTSGLGQLSSQPPAVIKRLSNPAITFDDLERMAAEAPGGYGASKAALNVLARLFAREFEPRGILVNATSPGWCRTDMGGSGAPRSARQGADSVLWGVRLPDDGPNGGIFEDGEPIT